MENLKEKIQTAVNIYKSGNLVKAEEISKKLIKENPRVIFLYNLLGLIFTGQKKIEKAIECYEKGLEIDPNYAMIYNNLGIIYFNRKSTDKDKKDYIKRAEIFYKKSIELNKKIPEPITNLGNLYSLLNKSDEAIRCHKRAIKVDPKFYFSYLNLANVYISIGCFDEAKKYLKEVIIINPNFSGAHRILSRITKYTDKDKHLVDLIKLYKDANNKNTESKMNLGFALGKAHEDIKKFDKSFSYYKDANLISRKKIFFSLKKENDTFNEIKMTYNKKLFDKFKDSGCLNSSAIFIVGMPRSGTTLIEQILSNHSKVFGADEVEFIPNLVKKYFMNTDINLFLQNVFDFDANDLKKIGEEYIARMKDFSNNSIRTTDKLPANFLSIGLIKLILPGSKIIHCYRNSKDNIFSIFKNYFPGGKINYASDLNEIVEYYNLYYDIMKYWNNILPNFILNIKYENLILNTEFEIKKLVNFCDLEWQNDCLKFYDNKRIIKTASDTQVRNKIYNTSIDSWKNYKKYLNEYFINLKN